MTPTDTSEAGLKTLICRPLTGSDYAPRPAGTPGVVREITGYARARILFDRRRLINMQRLDVAWDALLPKLISGELHLPAALRNRASQAGVKDTERFLNRRGES